MLWSTPEQNSASLERSRVLERKLLLSRALWSAPEKRAALQSAPEETISSRALERKQLLSRALQSALECSRDFVVSLEHSQRYAPPLECSQSALERGGNSLGPFSLEHSGVLQSAPEGDQVLLMKHSQIVKNEKTARLHNSTRI